ncbi:MAG: 30S ribosomal protein S6 [Deltaproteobacteria bacterium]|nr:30S ribosomal protein S6 [Deltaproteobacteria bacterium]
MAEVSNYLREYETIYVLKPDLEDSKVIEVAERMRGVVEQQGGKSIKIHNWGKKKLAYEVDKVQKGVYIYHHYLGGPRLVAEYERVLKIMDEALIYQTARLADAVDANSRAVEPDVLTAPVRDPGKRDRDHEHDDRPRAAVEHGEESPQAAAEAPWQSSQGDDDSPHPAPGAGEEPNASAAPEAAEKWEE